MPETAAASRVALHRAQAARKIRERRSRYDLQQAIPLIEPSYSAPVHLGDLTAVFDEIERGKSVRVLCDAPPRHGKAVANGTPMLTRRGWVAAGDVTTADYLRASDGGWTRVTGVFPQGVVELYDVRFSDGSSLRTSGDHRWSVRQRYGGPSRVRTTAALMGDVDESDRRAKWRIPMAAPLKGTAAKLPIAPYLLGCWLGDGTSRSGAITTADPEIIGAFRDAGFRTGYEQPAGAATTYNVLGLMQRLRVVGVIVGRWPQPTAKHIPESYLSSSAADRLSLLQGLCDTDGTVAKNGSQQSYTTTRERLAHGFRFLVNSLGGVWTQYSRLAGGKTAYTLHFRLPHGMKAFRLCRKQNRLSRDSARNVPRRFIRSIGVKGKGEATCFSVTARDSLFCAGRELILTHNTDSELLGMVRRLKHTPTKTVAFCSYADRFAWSKSRKARRWARKLGIGLQSDSQSMAEWRTQEGGGFLACGIDGQLTGHGIDLGVLDDPYSGRAAAESPAQRLAVMNFYSGDFMPRFEPGASGILSHTRWTDDDLIGVLKKRGGWDHIHLPVIDENGTPIWSRWSKARLARTRVDVGEYDWWSLYMGQPRPRGGRLFNAPARYTRKPRDMRLAIAIDFAYSATTSSDFCVAILMGVVDPPRIGDPQKFFVLDVVREQVVATQFARTLQEWRDLHVGVPMVWQYGGTEIGIVDLLADEPYRLEIQAEKATTDKFVRSLPMSASWNAGRVLLPTEAEWLADVLDETKNFRGKGDTHDDIIDALVAGFSFLELTAPSAEGYDSDDQLSRWDESAGRGF